MTAVLRALGIATLVAGLLAAAVAGRALVADTAFADAAAAYARHPEHDLFRAEYLVAAARHYGLLAAIVAGIAGGAIIAAFLLGLAEILRRLPRATGEPR